MRPDLSGDNRVHVERLVREKHDSECKVVGAAITNAEMKEYRTWSTTRGSQSGEKRAHPSQAFNEGQCMDHEHKCMASTCRNDAPSDSSHQCGYPHSFNFVIPAFISP